MGIINRLLTGLSKPLDNPANILPSAVFSSSLTFLNNSNFYKHVITDVAKDMTLTGQEARIQLRYRIPDHPKTKDYEELCVEYKEKSAENLKKLEERT